MIIELTQDNFEDEIGEPTPILVDFWASWCGPCMMQGEILHRLDADHPELRIGKLNVDDERKIAMEYGIQSIPTMILFKDGEPLEQVIGLRQASDIRAIFMKAELE